MADFKRTFYCRKDLVDVEQILRLQVALDRDWVRERVVEMFGRRDLRVSVWDELVAEVTASSSTTQTASRHD